MQLIDHLILLLQNRSCLLTFLLELLIHIFHFELIAQLIILILKSVVCLSLDILLNQQSLIFQFQILQP